MLLSHVCNSYVMSRGQHYTIFFSSSFFCLLSTSSSLVFLGLFKGRMVHINSIFIGVHFTLTSFQNLRS